MVPACRPCESHTLSAYRQTYSPAPALRLPKWLLSLWYWF